MTSESTIDYEGLAQEAMRGVVRTVLIRTAKTGLYGDHHFYISFDTEAPGVSLSRRLKEKYPREMTIVLQHRFWDLAVTDERFEVKLTFDGIPERLVVPFAAIKVFFDPSVRFGLQFEDPNAAGEGRGAGTHIDGITHRPGTARGPAARKTTRPTRKRAEDAPDAGTGPTPVPTSANSVPLPVKPATLPKAAETASAEPAGEEASKADAPAQAGNDGDDGDKPAGGAQIVSLDKFRKR